jgi:nucleoside-diphosphate-sugar epimerase
MKQRVLVLGANGFIGREVVAVLASSDWATPVLGVRKPTAGDDSLEQLAVNASDLDSVLTALQGVTHVVNCVAGNADTIEAGAKALLASVERMPSAPRIVHLSGMVVYGVAEGTVDESAPLRGDLGDYSAAKVAAEAMLSTYPKTVIFRPGCVFGPGSEQWTIRIARLLLAHRLGDLGAAGDGYCNLVHVSDVAQAILKALQTPRVDGQAFNLAISEPPTWNEFLVKFGISLRAIPVRRISERRLRFERTIIAPPLMIAELLARVAKIDVQRLPPSMPPSLLRSMRQEIRLDSHRAEIELGLRWRSVGSMIEESARGFWGAVPAPLGGA